MSSHEEELRAVPDSLQGPASVRVLLDVLREENNLQE